MKYYTTLDVMARKYERMERKWEFRAQDCEAHQIWRQGAAKRLREISGVDGCEKTDMKPQRLEIIEREGYCREYWTIYTEPEIVMPFYLLRPRHSNGGAMVIPHGHGSGKEGTICEESNPGVQASGRARQGECLARSLAQAGYMVFCPDERGSGERREAGQQGEGAREWRSNSHRELLQVAIGFGQSLIGLAVWDLMRLVDFVEQQPEVKAGGIGCAGMSGGGQQTLWLAALDERIRAAVTSGYFYGMKESLVNLGGNCSCNYVPHMWETMDMGDMGAMIAPRPLFIESGEKDGLNGPSGLNNVFPQVETARKAYGLYGVEERLVHRVHPGGHQWVGDGVMEFLGKYLLENDSND